MGMPLQAWEGKMTAMEMGGAEAENPSSKFVNESPWGGGKVEN